MGIFNKKDSKQEETQQELDMLVTTTDSITRPYEEIGLVTVRQEVNANYTQDHVVKEIIQKAKLVGADAVIGFRYSPCFGTSMIMFAYGTAVKFK